LVAEHRIASISIARIERGELVYADAWGEARPGTSASPSTLYNVASLAKPMSAEVAIRLAASGVISLDEPMGLHWLDPDVKDDPRSSLLTARHVLSHRSGLPNWRWEDGGTLKFRNTPGAVFGYSGEGFEWLARVIEQKTAKPFEELAQTLVFDPNQMRDTSYTRRPWTVDRLAVPYNEQGAPLPPQIADSYIASDDLMTTATDYGRFIRGLMREEGVTPAFARERLRLQTDRRAGECAGGLSPGCPEEEGMALGWETLLIGGQRYLMHTGADEGTFAFAYWEPGAQEGLVILTNSSNGWRAVLPLLEAVGATPAFIAHLRRSVS